MTQAATQLAKVQPVKKPNGVHKLSIKVFEDENGDPINAIAKVTPAGIISATVTRVPLSVSKGELYHMPGMVNGKWDKQAKTLITASGYDKLNQFAGITMHQPETVLDDGGTIRPNPYFHNEGGQLVGVRIRMQGLGRNAVGSIALHDNTLFFDVRTYLAQDLWSKWTGRKSDTVKEWGKPFPAGRVPKEINDDYNWLQVAIPNGIVLCVDLGNKEVIAMMGEQISRTKFAERLARTICKRNILKTFFGAVVPEPEYREGKFYRWSVPIVSWPISDYELKDFGDLAARAKDGELVIDGETVDPNMVDATCEVVDNPDDVEQHVADVVDETDGPQEEEPDEPTAGIDPVDEGEPSADSKEADGYRETIRTLGAKLTNKRLTALLKKFDFKTLKDVAECSNSLSDVEALGELASTIEAELSDGIGG